MTGYFAQGLEFIKGVGPQRSELLKKELGLFTIGDLIQHYPFRYEDRTRFHKILEINDADASVQIMGQITSLSLVGPPRKQRLVAQFSDGSSTIELVWFKGVKWMREHIKKGVPYVLFGKPSKFGSKYNIVHPEMDVLTDANAKGGHLQPIYHSSEMLKKHFVDSKFFSRVLQTVLPAAIQQLRETLPSELMKHYRLMDRINAIARIHFPENQQQLEEAQRRLRFEELFFIQMQILQLKGERTENHPGFVMDQSHQLTEYYEKHLPFTLTGAQKKVIKEIYADMRSGKQMNRLLQGDVGSGKTMVAFLSMLIAIGSGTQCAFMAPTEILAEQHYKNLRAYCDLMGLRVALLTGSTKTADRKLILNYLREGDLHVIVGTHALLEDRVAFKKLGLAVIDEQHRFGVAQRARLWGKNENTYPHMLVMTATPIPRTLAMTLYGDLDVSVIDELPAGRKPIKTVHYRDSGRLKMFGLIEQEIKKGRQIYMVYPLIEESEKLDYNHLMDGYESISRRYPEMPVSVVHGRMKSEDKEWEMQRFVKGETKLMVATTVIEVGVDVPNASVMVIESSERFGLSQLHQLRGRVGRGAEQSYCVLMSGDKLSNEGRTRLKTMVDTTDGFKISEVDLNLRGPGDLMGTQQSGIVDLLVSNIARDGEILKHARIAAQEILRKDLHLALPEHAPIRQHINSLGKNVVNWGRIS
jgi:ATP-dependent DNA helicase RecG